VQIFQRRRRLAALSPLQRAWLAFRGALLGSRGLKAAEQLHVVLVGRRFSSRLSHMVFNATKKCFELEIWDVEAGADGEASGEASSSSSSISPRLLEVLPQQLGAYVKQAPWEQQWWDQDEENKLVRGQEQNPRS
jgi:hypothetical protein